MKCVCGKDKMDGIRCKFGASHRSLLEYERKRDTIEPTKTIVRERLPIKRERLDLFE